MSKRDGSPADSPLGAIWRRLKRSRHANLAAYGITLATEQVAPWPTLMPADFLRRFRRVLVLAPHPDDETFGMGGLLLLLQSLHVSTRLRWMSSSEDPTRVAEALAVAAELGCAQTADESFPIAGPPWVREATDVVHHEISTYDPDLVCSPSVFEPHYDHARTAVALRRALVGSAWKGQVLQYEVWSTVVPNALVDVSSVVGEKERLMRTYRSQLGEEGRDYVGRLLALNRYRGLAHNVGSAEAFILSDAASFVALSAPLARREQDGQ